MAFKNQIRESSFTRLPVSQKNSLSSFTRKAVLTGGVALAALTLNAQVRQINMAADSTKPGIKLFLISYTEQQKNVQQKTPIEFVGTFEVTISKYPTSELKINNEITLSIEEQKALRKQAPWFLEHGDYVLHYVSPSYFEGIMTFKGCLDVLKKKQSAREPEANPSDTLK